MGLGVAVEVLEGLGVGGITIIDGDGTTWRATNGTKTSSAVVESSRSFSRIKLDTLLLLDDPGMKRDRACFKLNMDEDCSAAATQVKRSSTAAAEKERVTMVYKKKKVVVVVVVGVVGDVVVR